jgi:hypothetical protein
MKTWVVLPNPVDGRCWMGNAESPAEAAMYARGKGDLIADEYIVWDWDANSYVLVYQGTEA